MQTQAGQTKAKLRAAIPAGRIQPGGGRSRAAGLSWPRSNEPLLVGSGGWGPGRGGLWRAHGCCQPGGRGWLESGAGCCHQCFSRNKSSSLGRFTPNCHLRLPNTHVPAVVSASPGHRGDASPQARSPSAAPSVCLVLSLSTFTSRTLRGLSLPLPPSQSCTTWVIPASPAPGGTSIPGPQPSFSPHGKQDQGFSSCKRGRGGRGSSLVPGVSIMRCIPLLGASHARSGPYLGMEDSGVKIQLWTLPGETEAGGLS